MCITVFPSCNVPRVQTSKYFDTINKLHTFSVEMQNICEMFRKHELSIIEFSITIVVLAIKGLARTVLYDVCPG
jgi:hypothetical protein